MMSGDDDGDFLRMFRRELCVMLLPLAAAAGEHGGGGDRSSLRGGGGDRNGLQPSSSRNSLAAGFRCEIKVSSQKLMCVCVCVFCFVLDLSQ